MIAILLLQAKNKKFNFYPNMWPMYVIAMFLEFHRSTNKRDKHNTYIKFYQIKFLCTKTFLEFADFAKK